MRILLVDDDPGFRALLRTTFEVVDVEVREAENVAAAEAAIEAARPDVLVLDVRLPARTGSCCAASSSPTRERATSPSSF